MRELNVNTKPWILIINRGVDSSHTTMTHPVKSKNETWMAIFSFFKFGEQRIMPCLVLQTQSLGCRTWPCLGTWLQRLETCELQNHHLVPTLIINQSINPIWTLCYDILKFKKCIWHLTILCFQSFFCQEIKTDTFIDVNAHLSCSKL